MKTLASGLRALLVALVCCAVAPQARGASVTRPVADASQLNLAISQWLELGSGTDNDLVIELQGPGVYALALNVASLTPQAQNIANGLGALPGSLSIGPANTTNAPQGYDVTIPLNMRFPPGKFLSVNQIKFQCGAVNLVGAGSSVIMKRVLMSGGAFDVGVGATFTATSSCFTTGGFNLQGITTIQRCTVLGGTFNISGAGPSTLDQNIFMSPPAGLANAGNLAGKLNYIPGYAGPDPSPEFVLLREEVLPPTGPVFEGSGGWPGKLTSALYPRDFRITGITNVSTDFDGEAISGRPQIGADEKEIAIPAPAWTDCVILGPVDATLYEYPTYTPPAVPIVGANTPVAVRIVTEGLFTDEQLADTGALNVVIRVTPQLGGATPIDFPVAIEDIQPGNATRREYIIDTEISGFGKLDHSFDGLATISLLIDLDPLANANLAELNTFAGVLAGATSLERRQLFIDTLAPEVPRLIDATSIASVADTSVVTCGGWALNTTSGAIEGVPAHFLFNPDTSLDVGFSVVVNDTTDNGFGVTVPASGFVSGGPIPGGDLAADIDDTIFGKSTLGAVSWVGDPLPVNIVPSTTNDVIHASVSTGMQVTWNVRGTVTSPVATAWQANLRVTDRAGNFTDVPLPTYFWWLPEGSTFAEVTNSGVTAENPRLEWQLAFASGGPATNIASLLPAECRPQARFLLCRSLTPTAPLDGGWESVGGLDWTDPPTPGAALPSSLMGGGVNTLYNLVNSQIGEQLIIAVKMIDPAGNVQSASGLDSLVTSEKLNDLANANVGFVGPFGGPTSAPAGSIDTSVSVRYFLNRVDRGNEALLWNVDDDETTYGSGPNVPITPITACGQRLEAEFLVNVGVPDVLPENIVPEDISVEFQVYEDGKIVARGNLLRELDPDRLPGDPLPPMKLMFPTDLLAIAGNGPRYSSTDIFMPNAPNAQDPLQAPGQDDCANFLAEPPIECGRRGGDFPDRLGNDGTVFKPGSTNADGSPKISARQRPVEYKVVFFATNDTISSGHLRASNFLYDLTPVVVRFVVTPDQLPDSEPPAIKVKS